MYFLQDTTLLDKEVKMVNPFPVLALLSGESVTPADNQRNLILFAYGQFIDHDLTFTPIVKGMIILFYFWSQLLVIIIHYCKQNDLYRSQYEKNGRTQAKLSLFMKFT